MDLEIEKLSLSIWQSLSDDIIIKIFYYLPASSLLKVAQVCKTYHRLALDEILWKDLFYRHWKVDRSIPMSLGKVSWVEEYKRLYYYTPAVESEVVRSHIDEVLHVSFSHNGRMFATSSKDGFIKVWDKNSYPCLLKNEADMSRLKWKYTFFSEFNESDTLLLVSGPLSADALFHGEIVIFSLQGDFEILSQVTNTPYTVNGTWYNDCFLSGSLNMTGHDVSCSDIWLRKTNQKMEFKQEPLTKRLFHFRNKNYNKVRRLMIANVFRDSSNTLHKALTRITQTAGSHPNQLEENQSIYTLSMLEEKSQAIKNTHESSDQEEKKSSYSSSVNADVTLKLKSVTSEMEEKLAFVCVSDDVALQTRQFGSSNDGQSSTTDSTNQSSTTKIDVDKKEINVDFRVDRTYLDKVDISSLHSDLDIHGATIFSVNSQPLTLRNRNCPDLSTSYKFPRESNGYEVSITPELSDPIDEKQAQSHLLSSDDQEHKANFENEPIGAKLSANNSISIESSPSADNLPDKYLIFTCGFETFANSHIGIKLVRAQEYFDATTGQLLPNVPDVFHSSDGDAFDSIDHLFDMHGEIIGMRLSPDDRYLYVSSRRWQDEYQIDNPKQHPPLSEEIELHVFDLLQLKMVGKMDTSHKAYSPSNKCFLLDLDVHEDYVASGGEDKHGYIWDRHYGICLNKFPHSAVVNSVAFNPVDPEMLVTVSDDFSIKVWRSRNSENNLIKFNMQLEQCGKQETNLQENIGEAVVAISIVQHEKGK